MTPAPYTVAPRNPQAYRLSQMTALALSALLLVSSPLQVVLALSVPSAGMFVVSALLSLVLVLPLVLMASNTPPVTLSPDGITLQPWPDSTTPTTIGWDAVKEIKPYPLLPPEDAETVRKVMVGKKNYRPAEGLMFVCEGLPWRYRVVGFFCGEGFKPVFAVTNRSHADYDDFRAYLDKVRR